MSTSSTYTRIPLPLLIGTGSVIFLANAGLLVLQLVGGRFLAPFIGSSVETWTSVIGVFLTGIALGNWLGGRLADRFPSPRTVALLLILSGASSLGMIGCYEFTLASGFYKSIPLGLRIPLLSLLFCLPPALFMSLLTPLTIKLLLPDVGSAGRIAGLIFALSTLGCLIGNYLTGFWLMAEYTLNSITYGVGVGLIALAAPVLCVRRADKPGVSAPAEPGALSANEGPPDGNWNFRRDIRLAYGLVFITSFCGMSLELTGVRVLAPILGVSLYTWTGIIGVMLAGTASGNWLGGVLADRGVAPALRRFSLLLGLLVGAATAPVIARHYFPRFNPGDLGSIELAVRLLGAAAGVVIVVPGLLLSKSRLGAIATAAIAGGILGAILAHSGLRALVGAFPNSHFFEAVHRLSEQQGYLLQLTGFAIGMFIALLFVWDLPSRGEKVSRSSALSGALFLGGLTTLAILLLTGVFFQTAFMSEADEILRKVLAWTFGLFFLPMLILGTISPQVIRLSIPDVGSAGRVAGNIYAWSTCGAIAGTFATGYFLIGLAGSYRVLMIVAFILTLLAFLIGKLWKNNAMLYGASVICGGAIFGLFYIGYGPFQYTKETKYYAIKVKPGREDGTLHLTLDHLIHSSVKIGDPTWLYYKHEYVQGELVALARRRNPETNVNLLVIGGGGYTFPRYVETQMPDVNVDVVEIDPGVTQVAHQHLGLPDDTKIRTRNLDGRQFISERAGKGHYQLVMQDAVNDYSVPYHLLTKEYNDAVKQTLAPGGAYLLTLIDPLEKGKLWRAAFHTLRQSFKHVCLLSPDGFYAWRQVPGSDPEEYEQVINPQRHVYIIYAADEPLDVPALDEAVMAERRPQIEPLLLLVPLAPPNSHMPLAIGAWAGARWTRLLDDKAAQELLDARPQDKRILTDQYCPVDNLMAEVFRDREK